MEEGRKEGVGREKDWGFREQLMGTHLGVGGLGTRACLASAGHLQWGKQMLKALFWLHLHFLLVFAI